MSGAIVRELRESPQTIEEKPESAEPRPAAPGAQEPAHWRPVAPGVRLLAVGVWDFIGIVSVLLGLLIVLVLWIAPFVGLGLAAYYVFRGRVSRWTLRVLVVGIPFAVAFGLALIVGGIVIYLTAILST